MQLVKIPRARLEEMAHQAYERAFPQGPEKLPPARNVRTTLQLFGAEQKVISFQGLGYELFPVSLLDGLRLADARQALEGLEDADPTEEAIASYVGALRTVIQIAPRYIIPIARWRRMLWKLHLRRNPFRKASERELGELLGFLQGCRMRSRVRYPEG